MKIKQPLFTTKSGTGSIGIGLSICDQILEAHEGKIHIDSHPGKGTTVTVKLPVNQTGSDPQGEVHQ